MLNKLISIQQLSSTLVNNAIQEGFWLYEGINTEVFECAKLKAEALINVYQPDWALRSKDESEIEELPDQKNEE